MSQAVKPQTSDFDLSRTSANRSRIRFANENGSLFNNDLMHKLQHNSCINSTEKYKFQIFHFCIDRAIVNQLTLLLHRLLHEVKIVQTILDEYLDTETVSRKILNQWPWLFSSYLIFSVASPYSDGCISNPAKQRV